eukprot:m.816280 g.816280  ORF g.816280 m.816280 type:complete len:205 (+) comp59384_c0_seq1:32-646(+)
MRQILLLLLLLPFAAAQVQSSLVYNNSRYFMSNKTYSWQGAISFCAAGYGQLAYFETSQTMAAVVPLLSLSNKSWLYGQQNASNKWNWNIRGSLTPLPFTNWKLNEPNGGPSFCISTYGDGLWDDAACDRSYNAVCRQDFCGSKCVQSACGANGVCDCDSGRPCGFGAYNVDYIVFDGSTYRLFRTPALGQLHKPTAKNSLRQE